MTHRRILVILFLCSLGLAQTMLAQQVPPKREFRAAWICTLANLDWPSKAGMNSDLQKVEFTRTIDEMAKTGLNAVITQVRPAGDAFYPSKLVPWSQYLTGYQGRAPFPYYDPLKFMVKECHARNLEFHAWFNPFRALSHIQHSTIAVDNPIHDHPEWFYNYGNSKYFDPGVPAARHYLVQVVMEVVRNYDVDGIHLDDYFYPYPIPGQAIPDSRSYKKYGNGYFDKKAWRRHNVDAFVEELADSIFLNKPNVKFGISPFGVWRNGTDDVRGSSNTRALSAYDELYADTRKWLKYGWVDYMAPQLYWNIGHARAPFQVLLDWWDEQGSDRHVYIGHGAYMLASESPPSWARTSEFMDQVDLCRAQDQVCGNIWFRASTLRSNSGGITTAMRRDIYKYPALVPAMPWIDSMPPNRPRNLQCSKEDDGVYVSWDSPRPAEDLDEAAYYIVYRFEEGQVYDMNDPRNIVAIRRKQYFFDLEATAGKAYTYVVTSVDRLHNESDRFVHREFLYN